MGATIHMHYCMGKIANWSLDFNTSKICGKCGMEKSDKKDNGCCKDEDKYVINHTDQKTAEAGFQPVQLLSAVLPVSFIEIPSVKFQLLAEENFIINSPPRSNSTAVYLLNRSFRI